MDLREKVIRISDEVRALNLEDVNVKLPQNAFYLRDNKIVCFEREKGESRFPYDADGLVVWARSSGYIEASESTFNVLKSIVHHDNPSVGFFTGMPLADGRFFPVSVLGVSRQLFEPFSVMRYVVYSFRSAYYIAETEKTISAVRVHTDENKHIHFAYTVINRTQEPVKLYMANFIDPYLSADNNDHVYCRMNRFGEYNGDGSHLVSFFENYLVSNTKITGGTVTEEHHTVGRDNFFGGDGRNLSTSLSLCNGKIADKKNRANTTDIPVIADIRHCVIAGGDFVRIDFDLSYHHDRTSAENVYGAAVNPVKIDENLEKQEENEASKLDNMRVDFLDWDLGVNPHVLNAFLRNVQKQINLCALGKNYAGSLIGIRDVMQQLETCLIWQPQEARQKLIVALNYILEDGRPPRQFSVPSTETALPEMDLRKFIDQGNWIISTLYTYLCYTDDYSILKEPCGYHVADADNRRVVCKSDMVDTVLDHAVRIMNFLLKNVDKDTTHCLRALYGDWNDALDGLGRTKDASREYGTGVSVMASLHLYQNCREICEILSAVGGYDDKISEYTAYRLELEEGLLRYAVDENEKGERRIVHGWGDKMSYKIGSWKDPDGVARTSSTVNSFWVLSGMIHQDKTLKRDILAAFSRLDSKYGLLTFDKAFPRSMQAQVGRIATITEGTAENSAAYVHSATFAIMALFGLGESDLAWKELQKCMVISHENCSMTPFVMPNSYCCNPQYDIDGESMGDWYTGSGTVLVKSLVKYGLGIAPDLNGLTVQTAKSLPCKNVTLHITVKGHPIVLKYLDKAASGRTIFVNGRQVRTEYDSLMDTEKFYIPTAEITDGMVIEIID